jgi:predicted acyl esterase
MTLDGEAADATQALCPDYLIGAPESAGAYATGGNNAVGPNTYWSDRYFLDRALANYKGSIYAIHGLQDWNVDPHMMFPTYQALVDHGYEVKGLFGQWNHMYPDRPSEHVTKAPGYGREAYPQSVRYDWAQDLLEWFDHYLKGTGPRPDLHAEVQDNHGAWRIEPTYPPKDAAWQEFPLGSSLKQTSSGQPIITAGSGTVNGATGSPAPDDAPLLYDGAPLADATRISGLAQFPVTVMPLGPGGQVFAQLRDISPNGTSLRLGHAIMDLRYASGGSKAPQPVAPGLPLVAKMEFEVMDAVVPAGHHLQLALTATGEDYLPSDTSASVLVQSGTLRLPTVPLGHGTPFLPPAWSGKASATAQQP